MRKTVLVMMALVLAAVVAATWTSGVSARSAHGFANTWCDSPVVIPLATTTANGVESTPDVVTARGAEAHLTDLGPGVRLNELGSRVQVTLDETMFYSQWLFAEIDSDDAIRVDATLGSARQPISAASVRGGLMEAEEQSALGLTAVARTQPDARGEIDLFVGATEVLFTNESANPVDLIAAIGCPAVSFSSEAVSAPTWDSDRQQFLVEYDVTFANRLANPRTSALRLQEPQSANTVVDDLTVELSLESPGFSDAQVDELRLSAELERRRNPEFDGFFDTRLLDTPLELRSSEDHTIRLVAAFTPDFDDPAWSEGTAFPSPTVRLRGQVDDVGVGLFADLSGLGEVQGDTVETLRTPSASMVVEHEWIGEPRSSPDGVITFRERIHVENVGESQLTDVVLTYSFEDLFGEGTQVLDVAGRASRGCNGLLSDGFDGIGSTVLVFDADGIPVQDRCTVDIRTQLLPGNIPTASGVDYEAPVVATGRSGVRDVRDAAAVRTSISQTSSLDLSVEPTTWTNNRDGSYQLDGTVVLTNNGDQNLSRVAARIDLTNGLAEVAQPRNVIVRAIDGPEECGVAAIPASATPGTLVVGGASIGAGEDCRVSYSLALWPGELLDGWSIEALATATGSRGVPLEERFEEEAFELVENPSIEVSVAVTETTNNGNGNYTLLVETTLENTGDTPLVDAEVTAAIDDAFGSALVSAERIVDTCAFVDFANPVVAGAAPQDNCVARDRIVVQPQEALEGWELGVDASGTSPSTAVVGSSATSDEIVFSESPSIELDTTLTSISKLDNQTIQVRIDGEVRNTGDIEVRDLNAVLPLRSIFQGAAVRVDEAFVSGASISDQYDGSTFNALLSRNDTLAVGDVARWTVIASVTTGTNTGPFTISATASASSPASEALSVTSEFIEQTVPIIGITDRELVPTNNNDGTYSVKHTIDVSNLGNVDLPSISVFSDLSSSLDGVIIGEVETTTTCGAAVRAGEGCTTTERATVRPGSAVGPFSVDANVAATDEAGLNALVDAESPSLLGSGEQIEFEEDPRFELSGEFDRAENLGDGTYRVLYDFDVTNTGDVPLYALSYDDPLQGTYGELLAANTLVGDSCFAVSFGSPLAPGDTCTRSQEIVVRPLSNLGPWSVEWSVDGVSPAAAVVSSAVNTEALTFAESLSVDPSGSLSVIANRGNGTYDTEVLLEVTNTSDVPFIGVTVDGGSPRYNVIRSDRQVPLDSCSAVSAFEPLLPGQLCLVEYDDLVEPGTDLGPYNTTARIVGRSASGEQVDATIETGEVTFTERPSLSLQAQVASVESVAPETFRVVTTLDLENRGDVRVENLDLTLDLDAVFPDSTFKVDGVISDDFEVSEDFTLTESDALLAPGQSIEVGQAGTVILVVTVEPNGEPGPFVGELEVTGISPAQVETSTVIDAQIDLPSVLVEIVTQSVSNNRDGSYTVTTSYAIENDGSADLEFVRLTEDLEEIFAGAAARVTDITSSDIAVAEIEAQSRTGELLGIGAELASGERAVVSSTVLVTPGNQLGPFLSTVRGSAVSPAGTPVAAEVLSDAPITFVEQPALRVEQQLLQRPEWNPTGRFDVTFGIEVINDGDVELRGVQVRQDLLAALGANARITVRDIRSENLTVNGNFDGLGRPPSDLSEAGEGENAVASRDIGDTRLLGGLDTLAAGESGMLELDLTITPESRGVFNTRVAVVARTPAGTGVGSAEDVIEATTLTRLSVQGELGVAKRTIGEPVVRPDGSVAVTYEILVENVGPFPLTNVEVHDQLSQAFGLGSTFITSRVRVDGDSPCFGFASSSYDGGTIDPVLVSRVELQPNERCRIQYDANVLPSLDLPGPYRSSAFAIASDPFSGTVIDDSTDGTNTDPDGNQEPGDNDIATSVVAEAPLPELSISVEPLESRNIDRDGWHEFGYRVLLENSGEIDIDSTSLLLPLDEQLRVDYTVQEITSDGLSVNEGFDGRRDQNLLTRRNRLPAGTTMEVEVVLQSEIPEDGLLVADIAFSAQSVVGDEVAVAAPTVEIVTEPRLETVGTWFEALSVEERRLIALGAVVITLFLVLFIVTAVRRIRALLAKPQADEPEPLIDLRDDRTLIDVRDRAHPPVDESGRAEPAHHHHRPRRRRGRRQVNR